MHNGIVHDPGRSPGWIIMLPHDPSDKNGAWIRFDNTEGWPYGTIVKTPNEQDLNDPWNPQKLRKPGVDLIEFNPGISRAESWMQLLAAERKAFNEIRRKEGLPGWSDPTG